MPLHERAAGGGNPRRQRAGAGGDWLSGILPHEAAAGPLVDLVSELRPDLPTAIVMSLVHEALDGAAAEVLDVAWARTREAMPGYVAPRRHVTPYAERRLRQLADAAPRPGDYLGGPVTRGRVA